MTTTNKTRKVKKSITAIKKTNTKTPVQMRVAIAKDIVTQIANGRYRPIAGVWLENCNNVAPDYFITTKLVNLSSFIGDPCRWKPTNPTKQDIEDFYKKVDYKVDVKKYLDEIKRCSVCALGAIFMSQMNILKKITLSGKYNALARDNVSQEYAWYSYIFKDLNVSPIGKYFSIKQLALIEACFEGLHTHLYGDLTPKSSLYSRTFHYNLGDRSSGPDDSAYSGDDKLIAYSYVIRYKNAAERMTAIMNNIIRNKGTFIPDQDITKENIIKAASLYLNDEI